MPLYRQAQRDEYVYRFTVTCIPVNSVLEMSSHFYILVALSPEKEHGDTHVVGASRSSTEHCGEE